MATRKKKTAAKKTPTRKAAKKTAAKKTAAKKTAAKKTAAKKTAAKKKPIAKRTAKKTAAKKKVTRKTAAKAKAKAAQRTASRKKVTTKATAKKTSAKKTTAKKAPAKKAPAKKAPAKTTAKATRSTTARKTSSRPAATRTTSNPTAKKTKATAAAKRTNAQRKELATTTPAKQPPSKERAPAQRRFVWVDLLTPNPMAAMAFYAEVLGHSVKDIDMGTMTYHQISASGDDIGGIMHFAEEGVPPHWMPYVDVNDVDATCEKATALGGRVHQAPWDIPGVGRCAVIASPDGAVVAPITFAEPMPARSEMPAPGQVTWTELLTQDLANAVRFYEELFGWSTSSMDMGGPEPYRVFAAGEAQVAGAMRSPGDAPSAWLSYFAVDDVDDVVQRAEARGAQLVAAPVDVPGVGRIAILQDAEGAVFAVHRPG